MPAVMWGYSGANSNVVNLGFTHATASFGFNSPVTDGTNLSAPLLTLDDALISGLRLAKSGRINYPSDSGDGRYYRHERDGSYNAASPVAEISQPAMRNYARRLAADESRVFGDHPAFGGLLPCSEARDDSCPSFNTEPALYKRDTGKDKVNLVCCSMGGVEAVSYMYKYGSADLNRVIFLSSTVTGTHVTSDILRGLVTVTPNNLYKFVSQSLAPDSGFVQFLFKALYKAGAFNFISCLANKFIAAAKDEVYAKFLADTFGTMPTVWALVLPEYYDEAIE